MAQFLYTKSCCRGRFAVLRLLAPALILVKKSHFVNADAYAITPLVVVNVEQVKHLLREKNVKISRRVFWWHEQSPPDHDEFLVAN